MVSGANTDVIVNAASLASTAPLYIEKTYALDLSGSAWTWAAVAALLFRYGFSADPSPIPALYTLLLEVEYLPSSTSATLGGTLTAGVTEADLVAGGKVLTITLTGDTWIPA